ANNVGTSASVSFSTANADTVGPTVSLTAPTAGATIGGNYTVMANASDPSGVSQVKWYVDNVEVAWDGTGPDWSTSWNTSTVANGSHQIFAKAQDGAGNWGTSSVISFNVSNSGDTTPPAVSVTAPTAGSTVSGTAVSLTANASDASGVSQVKWY